jgi:hypothetical protein
MRHAFHHQVRIPSATQCDPPRRTAIHRRSICPHQDGAHSGFACGVDNHLIGLRSGCAIPPGVGHLCNSIAAPTFKAPHDLTRQPSHRILLESQWTNLQINLQLANPHAVGRCGRHRRIVRSRQKPVRWHRLAPDPAGHCVSGDQAMPRWIGLRLVGIAALHSASGWDAE